MEIIWMGDFASDSAESCCLIRKKILSGGSCEARKLLLSVAAQLSGLPGKLFAHQCARGARRSCLDSCPVLRATHTPQTVDDVLLLLLATFLLLQA